MVISVVLDTEYMGVAERSKWFLKSVSQAMKEDTLIVTHSYFRDHLEETVTGCIDRFYSEFEMDKVSVEQIRGLDICYVPDEYFDSIYDACGSRTKQLLQLYNERNKPIEDYIISHIDHALVKRGEARPVCVFNCLHTFASIKYIAKHYKCPLVPYVFSAVRKVHGYLQTLYMAHIGEDLFHSDACEKMYKEKESDDLGFPIFDKYEILALLGKKHNMPLLPLIERKGIYEVGIVGEGFNITPEIYQEDPVTDDDLYFESKRFFPQNTIITRQHPMRLDLAGLGREHMKNDPAAFLLSSVRVATVQSQMIMKAAMWNRAAVAMGHALPYAFLLNQNLINAESIRNDKLNFILFVYFVPNSCMFRTEYWQWRMKNPSTKEIAVCHMKAILSELGMTLEQIVKKENRINRILSYRGFSIEQIDTFLNPGLISDVSFDYPTSCLKCTMKDGSAISLYAVNHKKGDLCSTSFKIPYGTVKCEFVPQNDLDGFVRIHRISISSNPCANAMDERYYRKNETVFSADLESHTDQKFEAMWSIRKFN